MAWGVGVWAIFLMFNLPLLNASSCSFFTASRRWPFVFGLEAALMGEVCGEYCWEGIGVSDCVLFIFRCSFLSDRCFGGPVLCDVDGDYFCNGVGVFVFLNV